MITKGYVATKDGQIHYRRAGGDSGAPLVFLHMTASSSEAFERLMLEMKGDRPLFAFDSVNYGESYRIEREGSIPYMATVMLEALANLGVEQFHTFGHHTGASIQGEMAHQAPDRVLSTIYNGPTYLRPDYMAEQGWKDLMATPNPPHEKGTQLLWAWSRIRDNMQMHPWFKTPHAAEIMHRDTVDMLRAGTNWHWGYLGVFTHDLVECMSHQKCPMFFVSGKRDISYPLHRMAVEAFPDAPIYEHEEGGTYFEESHAEVLGPVLEDFLRSIEA